MLYSFEPCSAYSLLVCCCGPCPRITGTFPSARKHSLPLELALIGSIETHHHTAFFFCAPPFSRPCRNLHRPFSGYIISFHDVRCGKSNARTVFHRLIGSSEGPFEFHTGIDTSSSRRCICLGIPGLRYLATTRSWSSTDARRMRWHPDAPAMKRPFIEPVPAMSSSSQAAYMAPRGTSAVGM